MKGITDIWHTFKYGLLAFGLMIIIGFTAYYKLCRKNNDKYEPINDGVDTKYYQSV